MSDCTHNCSSCGSDCGERTAPVNMKESLCDGSSVGKVIGVVSGKGGVGKSLVTALLAASAHKAGKNTAIIDADITGPSIPKLFGLKEMLSSNGECLLPAMTDSGIQAVSINLLLENDTDPVVWRGPVIAGVVKQFWAETLWLDIDNMFIDMPPGTGDVPLTVFQSIPLDGIIIVATPQELVGMIVEKAVNMAKLMEVPILGLVENMSYYECPDCGKRHEIFGKSRIEELAQKYNIKNTARIPIDPSITAVSDSGRIEEIDAAWLKDMVNAII